MKLLAKNKYFPIFLLILISTVFLVPLFSNNFYLSHDGEAHVARFAAYFKAFIDGQFPLRWAGDLNYGYGSPVFIFYYPFPGLLSIPIHSLGASFESTFKLLIGVFFSLSFITFFLWAREFAKREVAFLGAMLYGLTPYHFLNIYVRGDVAEVIALAIVPLVFLFIKKSIETKSSSFIILASVFYGLLILSHNAVGLIFSPVILVYSIIITKKRSEQSNFSKNLVFGLSPIILGLMLSAFFWMPSLAESRYTNREVFIGNMFRDHFPSIQQLIYSPWRFGPDVNRSGGLSPQIGIINLIFAIGSIGLFFTKFKKKKMVLFWAAVIALTIFLTLNTSNFIWQNLPLMKFLQFPWRVVGLTSFTSVVLTVYFLGKFFGKKLILIFSVIVIFYSLYFLKIQPIDSKSDSFYLLYKGTTDYHGAVSSIWTAGDFSTLARAPYEIIQGKGKMNPINRKSNIHEFKVNASTDLKIVDNTVYFPGWRVVVDEMKTPIQFQDPNYRGLITFDVPEGAHNVKVIFGESPIRLLSDYLSLIGIFIVAALFVFRRKLDKLIVSI